MPPKRTPAAAAGHSKKPKPAASSRAPAKKPVQASRSTAVVAANSDLSDPFASDPEEDRARQRQGAQHRREHQRRGTEGGEEAMDVDIAEVDDDDDDEMPKTIPPDLLTRLLHEFFEKEGTRISKDANAAVAKYMDVFVRETIARTALEKDSGFLEVEDLEKVAPQLLLDL